MTNKLTSMDEYISSRTKDVQEKLKEIREIIKENAPMATETISYQMPAFKWKGNLLFFAAFQDHIGIYPGPEAIEYFKEKLLKYKTSKGTIQIPLGEPIPRKLIKEIVLYRVKQQEQGFR